MSNWNVGLGRKQTEGSQLIANNEDQQSYEMGVEEDDPTSPGMLHSCCEWTKNAVGGPWLKPIGGTVSWIGLGIVYGLSTSMDDPYGHALLPGLLGLWTSIASIGMSAAARSNLGYPVDEQVKHVAKSLATTLLVLPVVFECVREDIGMPKPL